VVHFAFKSDKMKKLILTAYLILILSFASFAQVAINTTNSNPAATSMLDISSTNKGLLIPRMTTIQRKAIVNPEMGLLVFDISKQTIYMFDGVEWRPFALASDGTAGLIQRKGPEVSNTYFGWSAAIWGNYAVIGAPQDTVNGVKAGSVYIYKLEGGTWKQTVRLFAPNAAASDFFGGSVDICNDLVAVGAPNKTIGGNNSAGRTYVFKKTAGTETWTLMAGLQATTPAPTDHFGTSVSVYGQTLVVGAPYRDHSGFNDAGSVYVFRLANNAWTQKTIINSWANGSDFKFGYSVDLWGSRLVAGSPYSTIGGLSNAGAAFTYLNTDADATVWANGQMLTGGVNIESGMRFGSSVAMMNAMIAVGAPGSFGGGGYFGIFRLSSNTWTQDYASIIFDPSGFGGTSVAIDNDVVYIGCPNSDSGKGRVIRYRKSGFDHIQTYISNTDGDMYKEFGHSVSAYGGNYVIGAPTNLYFTSVSFGSED